MKIKIFFLFYAFGLISPHVQTQNSVEEENLKRYWNYRDRFKKFYTRIGSSDGNSLVVANKDPFPGNLSLPCPNGTNDCGYIRFGDAIAMHGAYLSVLATEYKLLKEQEKNCVSVLNELYYAIESINRVDKNVEPYLSQNNLPHNLNGFFMRDDVPATLGNHWNNFYPLSHDPRDRVAFTDGDAYNIGFNPPTTFNPENEESQDQSIGLLLGFAFINKFVDNVYVKPTPNDRGFYIIDCSIFRQNIIG